MKKTMLKNILIKESKTGDLFIEIGETIEEIESLHTKLAKLIHKSGEKNAWKISFDLRHQIVKLKNRFGDVYDFKP